LRHDNGELALLFVEWWGYHTLLKYY
jgi:hypothetical protein